MNIGYKGGSESYVKIGDKKIALTREIDYWLIDEVSGRYTNLNGIITFINTDDEIVFMLRFGGGRPPETNEPDGGYFYCPYIPTIENEEDNH